MFPYLKICLINYMEKWMTNNNSQQGQKENKNEAEQQLALQLFCTKAAYTSLTKTSQVSKKADDGTVVFNDIVQLIKGNSQADFIARTPLLIKKINTDLSLRKIYLQLITTLKFAESGLQAAASSGLVSGNASSNLLAERITEQFSLKFKRDPQFLSQVYVILTIDHPTENHLNNAIALHITTETEVNCLYFPLLINGKSQLLMEDDNKHFILLTHANSHLYLI